MHKNGQTKDKKKSTLRIILHRKSMFPRNLIVSLEISKNTYCDHHSYISSQNGQTKDFQEPPSKVKTQNAKYEYNGLNKSKRGRWNCRLTKDFNCFVCACIVENRNMRIGNNGELFESDSRSFDMQDLAIPI